MNKCIVCNSKKIKKTYVFECLNCGYSKVNNNKLSQYEYKYHVFQKKGVIFNFIVKIINAIRSLLIRLKFSKDTSILEIGCGQGDLLLSLKNIGFNNVQGIEISKYASNLARKKGINVLTSDFNKLSIKNKFDLVIMSHVVEHLPNPNKSLKKIRSILNEKGCLILSTPNGQSMGRLIFKKYWYDWDFKFHEGIFNLKSLSIALNKSGFQISKINYSIFPNDLVGSFQNITNCNNKLLYLIMSTILFPITTLISFIKLSGRITVISDTI